MSYDKVRDKLKDLQRCSLEDIAEQFVELESKFSDLEDEFAALEKEADELRDKLSEYEPESLA